MQAHPTSPLVPEELLARFHHAAKQQAFAIEEIAPGIPAYSRQSNGPTDSPVIQLSAGIHGDEPAGPLAALAFLKSDLSPHINWLLTPLLNPSGIAQGTRENKQGLDLNRDYHLPQSAEIQAHCHWLNRQPPPDLFISLHEDYEGTGFYLYEIQTGGQPTIHDRIFQHITPHLPIEPGPIIDGRESSGDGWFFIEELPDIEEFRQEEGGYPEALFLAQKGCPLSLTFETPTHAAPIQTRIAAHLAAIEAAIDEFRKF